MSVRRYRKKPDHFVIAVQLNLDTPGLDFVKWGAEQHASAGDWIVDNHGEVHTVEREVFARTYKKVAPGQYVKTTPVWAEVAAADGVVPTIEGETHYRAGDYIVSNDEAGNDSWAIPAAHFHLMYELDQ